MFLDDFSDEDKGVFIGMSSKELLFPPYLFSVLKFGNERELSRLVLPDNTIDVEYMEDIVEYRIPLSVFDVHGFYDCDFFDSLICDL